MVGIPLRSAVSTSIRTGSDGLKIRAGPLATGPVQFGPMTANSTWFSRNTSWICFRKSIPSGMLSMSIKTAFCPKCSTIRSRMRPVIASESFRRYERVIFGMAQK